MNANVYWVLELEVQPGRLNDLSSVMQDMVEAARTNEPAFGRVRPPLRAVDASIGQGIVAAMDRLRRPAAA